MMPATALEVATMPTRGYHSVSNVIQKNEGCIQYQCSSPKHCVVTEIALSVRDAGVRDNIT